ANYGSTWRRYRCWRAWPPTWSCIWGLRARSSHRLSARGGWSPRPASPRRCWLIGSGPVPGRHPRDSGYWSRWHNTAISVGTCADSVASWPDGGACWSVRCTSARFRCEETMPALISWFRSSPRPQNARSSPRAVPRDYVWTGWLDTSPGNPLTAGSRSATPQAPATSCGLPSRSCPSCCEAGAAAPRATDRALVYRGEPVRCVPMDTGKTRIAVVFGGRSSEHAISCVSAGSVLANLDRDRFEIVPVGITPEGGWVLGTADPAELEIREGRLPTVDSGTAVVLAGDPTSTGLVSFEPGTVPEVLSGVDVVFPVLHGAFGEDGTIQGLAELA